MKKVLFNRKAAQEFLDATGQLDRRKLRELIFSSSDARVWLEKLLHPLIKREIQKQIDNISAPYCIVSIPLLIENLHLIKVDRILVIDAPLEARIQRTAERDNIPLEYVEKIIKAQASDKERLTFADDIITNNKDMASLEQAVFDLHHKYLKTHKKS